RRCCGRWQSARDGWSSWRPTSISNRAPASNGIHAAVRIHDDVDAIVELGPSAVVVEGFHHLEALRGDRAARAIDVRPTPPGTRSRETLVKDIEVEEPSTVHEVAVGIDVRAQAVRVHDRCRAFAKIARISPSRFVGVGAIELHVLVAVVGSHDTTAELEV